MEEEEKERRTKRTKTKMTETGRKQNRIRGNGSNVTRENMGSQTNDQKNMENITLGGDGI